MNRLPVLILYGIDTKIHPWEVTDTRALVARAFYGELSHSELAAETGLPLGTIKSRIRLALDRLRMNMS